MLVKDLLTAPRALIQLGVLVGIGTGIGGFIVNLILVLVARLFGLDTTVLGGTNEEEK